MGLAMATNVQNALVKRGLWPLKFYNRTASKGQTLQERGAEQCTSISDLVQKSDCICISVRYQNKYSIFSIGFTNDDFLDVRKDEQ